MYPQWDNSESKLLHPLTPRDFCQNTCFGHFGDFQAGYGPNQLQSTKKRHLQDDSMPFFPLASRFMTFLLEHAQKSKFG